MVRRFGGSALLLLILALPFLAQDRRVEPTPVRQTPRRLALVVGNSAYPERLINPVNDARALAADLRDVFFSVAEVENANLADLKNSVEQFVASLEPGDVALFYYSGHGMQIEGENWLIPIGFEARDEAEAHHSAYSAQLVLDKMTGARPSLSIVILDACRNNPFRRARGGSAGLAAMEIGKGTFISFATAPGATADDNSGDRNGLFTKYLLTSLRKPGLSLQEVFHETTDAVYAASSGRQSPWISESVVGNFAFYDPLLEERRLEALRAEASQLNETVKAEAAAREKAKTEEARRKAELAERAKQDLLTANRLEQERRTAELARAREFEAEREKLKQTEQARAKERELERAQAEAQLAELRRRDLVERTVLPTMSPLQAAAAKRSELTRQTEALRKPVEDAKKRALEKLDSDYAPLSAEFQHPAAKEELETTAQYQARLASTKTQLKELEDRLSAQRSAIDEEYAREYATESRDLLKEIEELNRGVFADEQPARWINYDADREILAAAGGQTTYLFTVPVASAKMLSLRKESLAVETRSRIDGQPVEVRLRDKASNEHFDIGSWKRLQDNNAKTEYIVVRHGDALDIFQAGGERPLVSTIAAGAKEGHSTPLITDCKGGAKFRVKSITELRLDGEVQIKAPNAKACTMAEQLPPGTVFVLSMSKYTVWRPFTLVREYAEAQ